MNTEISKIYYMYSTICHKIRLDVIKYKELNANSNEPTPEDFKIMFALIDIEENLHDIGLDHTWFWNRIHKYPFLDATPLGYIQAHGITGLFEVKIYVSALKYDYLNNI